MGVLASAQNLINNPHFSDGNAGFFSGYNYSSDLWPEGNYFVGSNPILYNSLAASFGDHTSGTGLMYIANGNLNPGAGIWIQSVNVTPNTTYTFTGWTASWGQAVGAPGIDPSPARLLISINGQVIPPFTLAPQDGVWTQFSMTWNSGNATTAILSLVDQNTDSVGNDFVLDDFEFAPVPEPASLVVVGIGVLAALRRRRRRI
jgi:hypothetical protein